jgi:gamma-glutamylcyclotransferase
MKLRVPSARVFSIGVLARHVLRFHKKSRDGSGKANAYATQSDVEEVWGVVYEINENELAALDEAEGKGHGYDRREVCVTVPKGDKIVAWVYTANGESIDDSLRPYGWYKRFVVEGARQHGLPSPYVESIESAGAVDDPDTGRDRTERSRRC